MLRPGVATGVAIMPVPHSYPCCALLMLASALAAAPVEAQLPDLCGTASRAQCRRESFSEFRYDFRVGGVGTGADHSIMFETGLYAYRQANTGLGGSLFVGADMSSQMRAGIRGRVRWKLKPGDIDAGIGVIILDSRGFEPSFAADLGFSPVRYLTLGGGMEVIRRPGSDVPWWFLGVRLRRTTEEPERLAFLLAGAAFIATLIRNIVN